MVTITTIGERIWLRILRCRGPYLWPRRPVCPGQRQRQSSFYDTAQFDRRFPQRVLGLGIVGWRRQLRARLRARRLDRSSRVWFGGGRDDVYVPHTGVCYTGSDTGSRWSDWAIVDGAGTCPASSSGEGRLNIVIDNSPRGHKKQRARPPTGSLFAY